MSLEKIPAKYLEPFDLYADVDHDTVRDYTLIRLSQNNDVHQNLQFAYDRNTQRYPEYLHRLIERGKFLEPLNDKLEYIDENMSTLRTYSAGIAIASLGLDALAYEMGVDQSEWRAIWVALPEHADSAHLDVVDEYSTPEECAQVGRRFMQLGQESYQQLEPPYQQLYDTINDKYGDTVSDSQVLRSSYGFIMRFGQKVIYSFTVEERLDRAVESILSYPIDDSQVKHLLPKRELRRVRRKLYDYHRSRE
jgi:hypothetical protein